MQGPWLHECSSFYTGIHSSGYNAAAAGGHSIDMSLRNTSFEMENSYGRGATVGSALKYENNAWQF